MNRTHVFATAALLLLAAAADAAARQPAPTPDGPRMFLVDGVRVIHERRAENEIVVARMYLLGGTRQITPRDAGIEPMLLYASAFGSKRYPAGAGRVALARSGSSVWVTADNDWSTMTLRTVRPQLDSAWQVFADRLAAPVLEWRGVERIRRNMLASLAMEDSDPDAFVSRVARQYGFAGHPYANDPNGTDRSLRAITTEMLQLYHARHVVKSRMLLVVVGNVDSAKVHALVATTLGTLPAGDYKWSLPPALAIRPSSMSVVPRKLETDYIIGIFPGPLANASDYGQFRVVTALLGSQVYYHVREKEQLAYAAGAPMYDHAATAGAFYASTTQPEKAVELIAQQMELVTSAILSPEAVPRFIRQFSLDGLFEQEANGSYADALARGYLVYGDFRAVDAPFRALTGGVLTREQIRNAEAWPESRLKLISVGAREAGERYMKSVQWIFVGDTARFRSYLK